MNKRTKKTLSTVVLYAVLAAIAVVALFPLFYIILASFRTDEEIFRYALPFSIHTLIPVEWTLENYKVIFTQFSFWRPILNTCLVVLILVPLNLMVASVAAYAFAFFDFKWKNALFAIFIVSFMVPTDSIALPLYSLISDMGLVNSLTALILPSISSGLAMFLFTQFFRGIPKSLLEAARVDGANWGHIFFQIVIPLSIPVFITAGLMIFVSEWNNYLWPKVILQTNDSITMPMLVANLLGGYSVDYGMLMLGVFICTIPTAIIFFCFQKSFTEGITGAVK